MDSLSLANYGSDDDSEDPTEDRRRAGRSPRYRKTTANVNNQEDVNYEEVQMDLSEQESNESGDHPRQSSDRYSSKETRYSRERDERYDRKGGREDDRKERYVREPVARGSRDDSYTRRDEKPRERDRDRYKKDEASEREDRLKDDRKNDRYREDRDSYRDDRYRDRNGGKYRDDGRRDSREKRSRRSSSRDRQKSRSRSRSPRRPDYSRNKRSSSRERGGKPGYSKRYDRASNKMAQLEKLGIEIKTPDCQFVTPSELQKSIDDQKKNKSDGGTDKDRFFMPGITGRFREQIERRKLLWQKKEPESTVVRAPVPQAAPPVAQAASSRSGKVWDTVNFAQDQDGKVASKFKRLMGIRGQSEGGADGPSDVLKKQEEMFSSMEQQYEVARTATHTMRGVGLGFGSYQR